MKVVLTHENTDFDAFAAQLAAAKLYAGAIPVLAQRPTREVARFVESYGAQLPYVRRTELPRGRVTEAIIVDAQSVPPIKGMDRRTTWYVIDHHPMQEEPRPGAIYTIDQVGAVTTLLVEKLRDLRVSLTPLEATLLLLGIYEDTGSLSYRQTTPRDLRSAAWLLEQGANLAVVNEYLRHPLDERYQAVYTQLMENIEWYHVQDNSVLIAAAHLTEYVEELSVLAHKLDDVFEPAATFLLFVLKEEIQLIARSATSAIDVGQVARALGGGGHGAAAAAYIRGMDLTTVRERIKELLDQTVAPPVVVRNIMSFGVHTLQPDMLLQEADALVRRYGHEGFPVVDEGRLVGILTRKEIDRALQHGLGNAPVRLYMHTGDVSVHPSDGVARVQQIMSDHGIGQLPVVENGRLLGIVTRTDLIKIWNSHPYPSRRSEIRELLSKRLPSALLDVLLAARDAANRLGFSLYVVGGFVRDLLLDTPTLDLDLVVEGEAIAVAQELGRTLGVRVRSHSRFGTATVVLDGRLGPGLPDSLDFVTARTEFYEHPTALPEVERSSIKQDLYRRDFTINTLAICLDRDRYGELLDFYGGERDLNEGVIRVLHNLSLVEDPTRILRAVRLEQRLGFRIEPRTTELIADALDLLDRVSGERLRRELELSLDEKCAAAIIRRLDELSVLPHLDPALRYDDWIEAKFTRAIDLIASTPPVPEGQRSADYSALDQRPVLLALLTYRLTDQELQRFVNRLRFRLVIGDYLREVHRLQALLPQLEQPDLRPSQLYAMLQPYSMEAVMTLSIAADSPGVLDRLRLYIETLQRVQLHVTGEFLKQRGLPPGPAYREILQQVLAARLDGEISTPAEEEALAESLLRARLPGPRDTR